MTKEEAVRDIRTVFTKDLADEIILTLKDSKSNELSEVIKNATNGDIIKAMFPDATIHIFECLNSVNVVTDKTLNAQTFDLDWWNAPYKTESEK